MKPTGKEFLLKWFTQTTLMVSHHSMLHIQYFSTGVYTKQMQLTVLLLGESYANPMLGGLCP